MNCSKNTAEEHEHCSKNNTEEHKIESSEVEEHCPVNNTNTEDCPEVEQKQDQSNSSGNQMSEKDHLFEIV